MSDKNKNTKGSKSKDKPSFNNDQLGENAGEGRMINANKGRKPTSTTPQS